MRALTLELVADDGAFARLEHDWNSLTAETPGWTGFEGFPWAAACRARLASSRRRLLALVIRDGGETIGIVPTQLGPVGDLRFIGEPVSNYQGPVYRPERVNDVVAALADVVGSPRHGIRLVDFSGLRETSPFFAAWCGVRFPGWDEPRLVRTAACPYVALAAGWAVVWARKRSSARGQLTRKWNALARLGRLEFVETTAPDAVRAELPDLFRLFASRWTGRRGSGGFVERLREFHEEAAVRMASAGYVRLSLLRLDGHVVVFCYGLTTAAGLTNYVTAHDDALAPYSPGALLLRHVLQAACDRGEREYDFSVGEERYKEEWATGTRDVFRVLRWRNAPAAAIRGTVRAVANQVWVAARSVDWMRAIKRDGLRRQFLGPPSVETRRDAPGLSAGPAAAWTIYAVAPEGALGTPPSAGAWGYAEMRAAFSPRLLELALDRAFRNDTLLVVQENDALVGVVWRCCPARRSVVLGRHEVDTPHDVFYHPVPAPGRTVADVVRALASMQRDGFALVARDPSLPRSLARSLGTVAADLRFKPTVSASRLALDRIGRALLATKR